MKARTVLTATILLATVGLLSTLVLRAVEDAALMEPVKSVYDNPYMGKSMLTCGELKN